MLTQSKLTIRYACRADCPPLALLDRLANPDTCWSEEEFQAFLACHNSAIYLAEECGELAGFLCLSATMEGEQPHTEIESLGVNPVYQRRGVGTRLVSHLSKKGYPIRAYVNEYHLPIQLFFRKLGFTVESTIGFRGLADTYIFTLPGGEVCGGR